MRLRTAKHRVVRVMTAAVALVMVSLVGILARNIKFKPSWIVPPTENILKSLSPKTSAYTEMLTFQHTVGNRTFYTLKAKTHEAFSDAPHARVDVLRGVEVIIYGDEAEPDRHIQSDECTYNAETGDIEFRGNVIAQLDEKTTGRTSLLLYRNKGRLAIAPGRISIERPDEMTAAANSMEFGIDSGLLKLAGKVHATLASGAELDSDAAVFQRNENWATVTGNVFVKSMRGWARAADGRAELEPGSFKPKTITLRGNVTAETRSLKNDDVWQLTHADRLDLVMKPTGDIDRAGAFGQARLEKHSKSGNQQLTGGELLTWIDARGDVERIEATQSARLETGDSNKLTTLEANKMRIDPAGTVVTEGPSKMDSGDSTITGQDFKIEQGDIATFATFRPATVDTRRPGAPPRHVQAQQSTTARIDSKTNRLISMVSVGSVQFTDGDRRGNADKATATDGGDTIVLEGKATVIDPKTRVDGQFIKIGERGATFEAIGAVKTVSQTDSDPVTVTADKAWGRSASGKAAEKVNYSGHVKTSAKSASGPLTIRSDAAEGNSTAMTYTGNVDTVVEADTGLVRILAASGAGNADRMTYKKDAQQVQLWRQTDNVYIKSDLLDVWPKEKRFTAEGTVHSEMKDVVGDSASLDYRDVRDGAPATARYSGNARLIQKDMTITASTVTAGLKDGRVSEATAVGGVRMTQGGRVGVGDQAVYNAEKDNAILTGRPATVSDPVKGNTQGPTVTMELSTKNATIVGASEELPQGRVRTRTNVGK